MSGMSDPVPADPIVVSRDGAIAVVTLNNPAKLNALTKAAWAALGRVMTELSADAALRCVIIRGAGDKAFAAGADITEFPAVRANADQARAYGAQVSETIRALLDCPHPIVAMIQGACTGGGLEIACACDIRISGASGRFGVPINRLGHGLAYPELKVVEEVAGSAAVLELLLEGRIMDADEAAKRGLVNRVVADERVEEEALATARRIAEGAPLAARANKKFVRRLMDPAPLNETEQEENFLLCDSKDYAEGIRAFLAKQKPHFKGR